MSRETCPTTQMRHLCQPVTMHLCQLRLLRRHYDLPSPCWTAPKFYLCRRPGHLARDCDLSTQIRSMSLSDRQDWLQGVMASVDKAEAQDKSEEHAEMSEQPENGQTLVGEDFVSHSG